MELFVYSGLDQLPSLDFECLRILAYAKFKAIPLQISTNGSPFHSPTGFLPYLKDNNEIIAGYDEIIAHFRSKGFDNEEFLSASHMCHFELHFMPYFKYVLWGDPQNAEITRVSYAKKLAFPMNFIYPQKYIEQTSNLLKVVANFAIEDKLEHHYTADIILNAKKYINMLAERIEKKRWFFGGPKPDEFDATIYAAISILLHLKLPSNDLKSHITECPKLLDYIDRIRKRYLLDIRVAESGPTHTIFNRVQSIFINKEKGTLSNGVIKAMFGILTISTMVFFAVSHGILEIVTDDDEDAALYYGDDDDSEHFNDE